MQIHENIRALREDHDLKQQTVAKYLEITTQQYSLYETGKREFKLKHIIALAHYFKTSTDWILGVPKGYEYPNNTPTYPETKKKSS